MSVVLGRRLAVGALAAITIGILLFSVFPTRTYFSQNKQLSTASERLSLLRKENIRLTKKAKELEKDSEIERIAREQYNMVREGEEAYALLPPVQDKTVPETTKTTTPTKKKTSANKVIDVLEFWK